MNEFSTPTNLEDDNLQLLRTIKAELDAEDAQFHQQAEEIAAHTDVLSLPWLPLARRQELPNVPGIYFVLENERVIYIGLSKTSLLRRWWTHHRIQELEARTGDIKIAWLECRALGLLSVIETAMILRFQPQLNQKMGNRIVPLRWLCSVRSSSEDIQRKSVLLRNMDWDLVEEVASKLKLDHNTALMWIVRLGAPSTPKRYRRMLKKLEQAFEQA
ncbi:GIY-YIG nuclease family protein [Chroococcidiopsidales cyanobacterium LEGE 13417]|uniref:GIY-YIG nuclease family protein n=1 Tax=Chroococcidiopsis sp. CCALA 051 TaxID=869949 RepID=UPI0011B227BC|nr:GIY-YIG nuclease family protein [Chroococcidiopsis sp. CCALA 051]MBE9015832.1 GIY-YIG nuclease family protein [Chroococcidiopsidales cyanobacterium LEGE 13417]